MTHGVMEENTRLFLVSLWNTVVAGCLHHLQPHFKMFQFTRRKYTRVYNDCHQKQKDN